MTAAADNSISDKTATERDSTKNVTVWNKAPPREIPEYYAEIATHRFTSDSYYHCSAFKIKTLLIFLQLHTPQINYLKKR